MAKFERDPEKLLQEMSARIKVRDIRYLHDMKEQMEPRWYESLLFIFIFPAAFGLIFILVEAVESQRYVSGNDLFVARFFYVWLGIFVLSLTALLEVLLSRLRAVRSFVSGVSEEVFELHREVARLKVQAAAAEAEAATEPAAKDEP